MKKKISVAAVSLLMMLGCGDPTLEIANKNDSDAVEKTVDSVNDVMDSYSDSDKYQFLQWISHRNHLHESDKKNASEIIVQVKNDYKIEQENKINKVIEKYELMLKDGIILNMDANNRFFRPFDIQKLFNEPKSRYVNENEKKGDELFKGISFQCLVNPDDSNNSVLVEISNNNDWPISQFRVAIIDDRFTRSYSDSGRIPGGINKGEKVTLPVKNAYSRYLKNGNNCHVSGITFYTDNKQEFGVSVYNDYWDMKVADLPEFEEYFENRIRTEINNSSELFKALGEIQTVKKQATLKEINNNMENAKKVIATGANDNE